MHPWCLSYVAFENLCYCGVLSWLHDEDERWHSFGANEVLSWLHGKDEYWHDFSANMKCWCDFVASWMLARLQCKWSFDVAQCKYWCNFNASASANVECCRGFMTKMNVGIASVRMKCWRGFTAKTSIGMTSVLMWSVGMTSWQKWIVDVASWLRYEWSDERWHGFDANEVLSWLYDKNECWHNFGMNEV